MSKTKNKWKKLDNAAKIFPSSSTRADTHVFRFSCELDAPIEPSLLQEALDETAKSFPIFGYVLRRGVFWYYLEASTLEPHVTQERRHLCAPLYHPTARTLLYAVSYFGSTVNLEVYHVISDGTGAMHFLRTLIMHYLARKNGIPRENLGYETAHAGMNDDSFHRYSSPKPMERLGLPRAALLRGSKLSENRTGLIRGTMQLAPLLEAAHAHHVTLTAYLCGCLLSAIGEELSVRARRRPVILNIPVNLRNYLASDSVRNFFTPIYVSYDFARGDGTMPDILARVTETFSHELVRERLIERFNSLTAFEDNIIARITPLPIKDLVLHNAYRNSGKKYTATLSNIGIVQMPEAYLPHIRGFHVCNATNKMQLCICSFGDKISLSLTSPYTNTNIQRRFFRHLQTLDSTLCIESNLQDDDS